MAVIYGIDLRERVWKAVNEGMLIKDASKIFNVNPRTIYEWKLLKNATGSLKARKKSASRQKKIQDLEKFKKFVEENSSLTTKEMAQKWTSETVSSTLMRTRLKEIGFSFKKKRLVTKNVTKKNEKNFKNICPQ